MKSTRKMNGKVKLMVESKKGKVKLMVSDETVEYVLAKYRKNWNLKDKIADVIPEDLQIKYGKRSKKIEEDFSRLLKAKKAKEAKEVDEAELKVNKEVVQVSSDEGFSGDEDVVCFNDVKYPLTDDEIRMFKETHITSRGPRIHLASTSTRSRGLIASTTSRAPRRQLASTFTRSKAPIASTYSAQAASTTALTVYRRIAMT
uniref:Uncharacterized protein n=1 Tax=Tanacetum cinerariifolium TaxID=118510 RepID=A0A6L2MT15_TANCI|nr:hypothetical protein [Tanacetum cinerariifolium]